MMADHEQPLVGACQILGDEVGIGDKIPGYVNVEEPSFY